MASLRGYDRDMEQLRENLEDVEPEAEGWDNKVSSDEYSEECEEEDEMEVGAFMEHIGKQDFSDVPF